MHRIKIGIFGVGHLGRFHTQNYKQIPGAEIVGLYDLDQKRCQEVRMCLDLMFAVLKTIVIAEKYSSIKRQIYFW